MARLYLEDPPDVLRELGQRARELRKYHKLSQRELAARADVSYRSLQRFESTGGASMRLVVQVAFALDAHELFDELFQPPEARTLEEFVRRRRHRPKRRGGSE